MSNESLIIAERSRDIGDFLVGRLLPFRKKRMVGPFIFVDHMGPSQVKANAPFNIGPHPHIGLSTLTYLFEGEVMHRDSLGSEQLIKPGEVNWMTAGKGIVHSERTPDHLKGRDYKIHGYQIWVALPRELESMEPQFYHASDKDLPVWEDNGLKYRLVAGDFLGYKSPIPVHSRLYLIEVRSIEKGEIDLSPYFGERGVCVVEGSVTANGEKLEKGSLLVTKGDTPCKFELNPGSLVLIFGGDPFPEERNIFWNFVSSSAETIEKAKSDWMNKRFPLIEGEDDLIPLPGEKW